MRYEKKSEVLHFILRTLAIIAWINLGGALIIEAWWSVAVWFVAGVTADVVTKYAEDKHHKRYGRLL